jgi:RNA polymerase sigma-70 factor (ECF subfamily)
LTAIDQLSRMARRARKAPIESGEQDAVGARRAERLMTIESLSILNYLGRRVAHREDAADLLSETMLVVWRRRDSIPADSDEARMWLFGVARNVLSTHRRTATRADALVERLRLEITVAANSANRRGRSDDGNEALREHVRELVRSLPKKDQEIIALVHWEGFSLAQVAVIVSARPSAVRNRYLRARRRLQALFAAEGAGAVVPGQDQIEGE